MDALELMPVRVRITSILKKAIYTGEYRSGDELSLSDVAARLGVSRTPVREAFQALEAEGLITLRMNKGAIVNNLDRKFIADIFDIRLLLESEAAARAAANGMATAALRVSLAWKEHRLSPMAAAAAAAADGNWGRPGVGSSVPGARNTLVVFLRFFHLARRFWNQTWSGRGWGNTQGAVSPRAGQERRGPEPEKPAAGPPPRPQAEHVPSARRAPTQRRGPWFSTSPRQPAPRASTGRQLQEN